jgi:hypothetical protein
MNTTTRIFLLVQYQISSNMHQSFTFVKLIFSAKMSDSTFPVILLNMSFQYICQIQFRCQIQRLQYFCLVHIFSTVTKGQGPSFQYRCQVHPFSVFVKYIFSVQISDITFPVLFFTYIFSVQLPIPSFQYRCQVQLLQYFLSSASFQHNCQVHLCRTNIRYNLISIFCHVCLLVHVQFSCILFVKAYIF